MAFNKYANGAWQEAETAKRYANGAWVECETAKRYISGAWQEVWTNAIRFLKNGVLMNGAFIWMGVSTQVSGAIKATTSDIYEDAQFINFYLTSDMVGKKLYVKASSNVYYYGENNYSYLSLYVPMGEYGHGGQRFTGRSGEYLTITITADHVATARDSYISLTHSYGADTYYIYDVFVDD